MYYIAVSSIGSVSVGERLLLLEDRDFGEISAVRESGEVVGYVVSFGIEGCLSKRYLSKCVFGGNRIVCDVALKSGDVMILSSEGICQLPTYAIQGSQVRIHDESKVF